MTPAPDLEIRLDAPAPYRNEARRLRSELRDVLVDGGVGRVEEVDVGRPPPGRRAGELEIVALAVSSVGSLAQVIQLLRAWKRKDTGPERAETTLTLTVGEATVTLNREPTSEELDVIRSILERHDGEADHEGG